MESVSTAAGNLGLVDKLLLSVIDDEAKPAGILLLGTNHSVFLALAIQVLFIGLIIRIVASPDYARHVMRTLGAEGKLKGAYEVVANEGMLHQFEAISVHVGLHPHNDLSVGVEDDGVVVLTHFCL